MAKQHAPGFLKLVTDAKSRVKECTIADMRAKRAAGEAFVLVDVREDGEFAAGHIPGAIHIGKGVIERDIEAKVPDPTTPLVLYCGGGFRSALAADALQKMGYTNVVSMDGGWRAWTEQGLPVEK
jgi:rhodanese-related sulfurtransferase